MSVKSLLRRRFAVMLAAMGVLGAACNDSQAQQQASSTPSVAEIPDSIRGSHDEPFVIDNGPAKLYAGRNNKPERTGSPKQWKRHAGDLKALAVHRYDEHGSFIDLVGAADLQTTMTTRIEITLVDDTKITKDVIKLTSEKMNKKLVIDSGQNLSLSGKASLTYPREYVLYLGSAKGFDKDDKPTFTITIPFDSMASTRLFIGFAQ